MVSLYVAIQSKNKSRIVTRAPKGRKDGPNGHGTDLGLIPSLVMLLQLLVVAFLLQKWSPGAIGGCGNPHISDESFWSSGFPLYSTLLDESETK